MQKLDLPEPSENEKKHSEELAELIKQHIDNAGGWLSFDKYMQLALYAPGLGYYSGGQQKFAEQGDFITAPETGSLFARTLARPVAALLGQIRDAKIIEFGAGSGKLAADLLVELQVLNCLPEKYLIVELSAELQQRQRETIYQQSPDLLEHVLWLSSLPAEPINAVVLANEVLDAMPVKRFMFKENKILQLGVKITDQVLGLSYREADEQLQLVVESLQLSEEVTQQTYLSEINCQTKPWIKSVAECINKGAIYLIDYGYVRSEFYSPERNMGTFMGYYRHRSMDAPLWYPGLQDLTAFVDFTLVAEAALENNLDVDGFTSQGNFLINCGLAEIVESTETNTEIEHLKLVQQMKTLSLPGEMGERFKVLGLSKGLGDNIPGFENRDLRYSL